MAWDPIDEAELNPGYPVLKHMRKAWNSLLWLYGQIGTAVAGGIQNGSFEVDADSGGVPDGWTWSTYPGGSIALDTTTPAHGSQAVKITHPGGAGNGGGTLTSDYIICSELASVKLEWLHWASAAGMKNQINIRFYTAAKTFISSTTLYNSTANPTSPTLFIGGANPPATARYYRVEIVGGYTDTNVTGTAYFDGFKDADLFGRSCTFTLTSGTASVSGGYADLTSASVTLPFVPCGIIKAELVFNGEISDSSYSTATTARYRCGSDYSNAVSCGSSSANVTFRLPLSTATKNITVYLQGASTSSTTLVYSRAGGCKVTPVEA